LLIFINQPHTQIHNQLQLAFITQSHQSHPNQVTRVWDGYDVEPRSAQPVTTNDKPHIWYPYIKLSSYITHFLSNCIKITVKREKLQWNDSKNLRIKTLAESGVLWVKKSSTVFGWLQSANHKTHINQKNRKTRTNYSIYYKIYKN